MLRHPADTSAIITKFRPHTDTGAAVSETIGRIGSLELKLSRGPADVKQAQKLRYKVFYKEFGATRDARTFMLKRDIDVFDPVCDHLLVIDHDARRKKPWRGPKVVGTYRLLGQKLGRPDGGFYTSGEYDVESLIGRHPGLRFLELGRSCVLPPYRDKRTVELLWHGIWTYVLRHGFQAMIGCASFSGTNPEEHALALSYLYHFARADDDWQAEARPGLGVDMNLIPAGQIDPKQAIRQLPPLIKGYLRIGARFGRQAVIDRQFGTTDVLVVLPVSKISPRYIGHFGAGAERHALHA
jgi:putative hemolysin